MKVIKMSILINCLGIQDSGGIRVLEKLLQEIVKSRLNYIIVCNKNKNIKHLVSKFEYYENLEFQCLQSKGILHRLYYENIVFRKIIKQNIIGLIYNFSGSAQFFLKIPQLTKVHNLLFYSKAIDRLYFQNKQYLKWLQQILLKRLIFHCMIKNTRYVEVQSEHVREYMKDFINLFSKHVFIKSDICLDDKSFQKAKNYDFSKKVRFFYIVGPHFESLHKNFKDFVQAIVILQKQKHNFEIVITLTRKQLHQSALWNKSLDDNTIFLGYSSNNEIKKQFSNNTIVISTSVIETLGLHVIEAIQNGTFVIVPDEPYSKSVYGDDVCTYKLFNSESLVRQIHEVTLSNNKTIKDIIQKNQNYLLENEKKKNSSVLEIFNEILKG